ncbi:MAG: VPLPA-CTERM sorting domain-containing protein [Pseudomonadota bacterium]
MTNDIYLKSTITALAMCTASQVNAAPLDIRLNYTNPVDPTFSEAMDSAVQIWEYLLPSYASPRRDVSGLLNPATGAPFAGTLELQISVEAIDGFGGSFGSVGPSRIFSSEDGTNLYTHAGNLVFDEVDIQNFAFRGSLVPLFTHQMAHMLGFGTLWDSGPYDLTNNEEFSGPIYQPTEYRGVNGLAAYRAEVDPTADFIPLEQFPAPGVFGRQWDESDPGAPSAVPGNFFQDELMGGILDFSETQFISETTVASFADLGYNTRANYDAMTLEQLIDAASAPPVVPLPAAGWMLLMGLGGFGVMRWSPRKSV